MTSQSKTWFITGASSGFGMAFAEYALAQGYNVVATARNTEKLKSFVAKNPVKILAVQLDVTNNAHIQPAVDAALKKFGRIDVLINNAGYGIVGAVEETPEDEFHAQMETNFFGAVSVTKKILPVMRDQKSSAIVNISSLGGVLSFAGFGAYSASKFALEGMSEALQQEVAPFGIKVLIVEPGVFRTEFAGDALRHMPKIEAYQDTVGGTREFAKSMHNTQEGDPMKAALAIDKALNHDKTPLRLQLGADSVSSIRAHSEVLLTELHEWESVALDTKLESQKNAA